MVRRLRCCIITVLVAASALLPAQRALSAPAAEKQRIAVLDLAQQDAVQEAEAIAEELRKILVKSGRYIVIDRTLTAQILKEWETQQSGLTEGEKAVKIGKLFNVQLIVSGKLNKFASGGWQLSAVMLDAQTGVAMKAETVRHRGDFFSLLDGKVPALGAALAGTAVAGTAPMPGSPAASAATRVGGKKRMAIYPALYSGQYGREFEDIHHDRLIDGIRKLVAKKFAGEIEIAREFASLGDTGGEKNDYISSGAWKGFFSKDPDEQFVYKSAREIGADLVLMFESTAPGGGGGKYHVYLFDAESKRSFRKTSNWKRGRQRRKLNKTVKIVLEKYRRARQRSR